MHDVPVGALLHLRTNLPDEIGADRFGLGELGIVIGQHGRSNGGSSYVILGQKRIAKLTSRVLNRELQKGIIVLCLTETL